MMNKNKNNKMMNDFLFELCPTLVLSISGRIIVLFYFFTKFNITLLSMTITAIVNVTY